MGAASDTLEWRVVFERLVELATWQYDFARDAMLAAMLVGALAGLVGPWLVLRRMSLLGDTVGHATLPGVVAAFLVTGAKSLVVLLVGGLVSGLSAAWLVERLARGRRGRPDVALAVVSSVAFGLGIVVLSYAQHAPSAAQAGLSTFLFGNAAAVTPEQLLALAAALVLATGLVALFYRPLALVTFDPSQAAALGMRPHRVRAALVLAAAIVVVLSLQATGAVLVAAMLVIPASTALLVARRLPFVVLVSVLVGAAAGLVGAVTSFVLPGVGTGPAMVLVAGLAFLSALGVRAVRRWVAS